MSSEESKPKESQTARILRMLKKHRRVTNVVLNNICFRYGARIHDLRQEGHIIASERRKDGVWEFVYGGHRDE
ncbi:helix-turn-helix domain-containing protein [Dietzia sp. MNB45]|uniref:helix-turn-helix domain-containing protein n=1 Tax=Dietzia sp. MNB45 TaxID=3238800 RepID=UPI003F7D698D